MYSDSDFEKLWFLYKTDGQSRGVSINAYCSMQGISYKLFYDWLRKRQKSIVPVRVDGRPCAEVESEDASLIQPESQSDSSSCSSGGIMISIQTRDGLHIQKSDLDYLGVKQLVDRLEGLC
ncbi:hypothetical protein [Bacteroides sp. 51]|uniref:hypothetical protein n=1 Tax=Bacteroides sp. 51 TaxID=2302938 RepID=UPI0013D4A869|nr:hypothetical protein [Bacteroides sp. 51]NDV81541.1 hypothetical protein [Bacteroides sp. 51]